MHSLSPCPDEQQMQRFAAGLLDDTATGAIRLHLVSCTACRERLAGLQTGPDKAGRTKDGRDNAIIDQATVGIGKPIAANLGEADESDSETDLSFLSPSTTPNTLGRIGNYDVTSVLGRGGMGIVLKAFDPSLHRTVAIKVLSPELSASRKAHRRFAREARAAAGINHPNVVTIHAVDEHNGTPYLVMEYVSGQSLRQRSRTGVPFDLTSLVRISAQIAAGLAAAHRHGVIHRDIKPANIMLEDGIERVKITDFGLALVAMDVSEITSAGHAPGTPAYMSPEQVAGLPLDPRSDLFSLGCVMYAMIAGRSPFQGAHALDSARRVSELVPPPLHSLHPEMPSFLLNTIHRLLEKAPARRFQTADEVHELLQTHLAGFNQIGTPADIPVVPAGSKKRPGRRSWLPLASLGLLLLLAVSVAIWQGDPWHRGWIGGSRQPSGPSREEDVRLDTSQGVLTVARAGEARFRDVREALAHAGPGTVVRILDGATYVGPFSIGEPGRLKNVTLESPQHALLENADDKDPVLFIGNTPGVVLRGLRIRARQRQHAISIVGKCAGLTVEEVRITQPPDSSHAAVVLWPGVAGSENRPIVLRKLEVECGTLGIAVLGSRDTPAEHVRIEQGRISGPGIQLTVETAARDVTVAQNLFLKGKRGISIELNPDQPGRRLRVMNNTFFALADWFSLSGASLEQADVLAANNLIVQCDAIQLPPREPADVLTRRFRGNWWEPSPTSDPARVDAVAVLKQSVKLLSRDPANPDFLRPAVGTMPPGENNKALPRAYVGALAP